MSVGVVSLGLLGVLLPGADPAGAAAPPGNLLAWGSDGDGKLGDGGDNSSQFVPVAVSGLGISGDVVAVSAGESHTMALLADGTVMAWGDDANGALGDGGTNVDSPVPVPVSGLGAGSGVVAIAAGGFHNLALLADGSVLAWGDDSASQLGDGGADADQSAPVPVSGLGAGSGVVAIAAGNGHSLAVRADGSVLAWGLDDFGQLGDGGANVDQSVPVPVSGLGAGTGVVAIAAGLSHSLAVRADGRVMAWGSDASGQIGDGGANLARPTPVAVSGLGIGSGVVAVAAGGDHSLARRADGSVLAWGSDGDGELGNDAPKVDQGAPVGVAGMGPGAGAVSIAAGRFHSLAALANGAAMAWGRDENGQVGADGGSDRPVPVQVIGLGPGSGASAVAAGSYHTLAIVGDAPAVPSDFDGDGRTDIAVYRPTNGRWYVHTPSSSPAFGVSGDIAVPGDYNGDGVTDRAIFRPSTGRWFVDGIPGSVAFGVNGDIPVPGQYDDDVATDRAVFRPSTGRWYIEGAVGAAPAFGVAGDLPVPADYDGDGRDDIAVYRPSTGRWFTRTPASTIAHGIAGDVPITADLTGDGIDDRTVFRPSTGRWYTHGVAGSVFFGAAGDVPVPGQYDADLAIDRAVYRPTNGGWYVEGAASSVVFGLATDRPVPISIATRILRYGA